jgi:alginate O-acetyltransferase complex protein AlgI
MLFNSFEYLIFLPLVFVLFYSAKNRYRWIILFLSSYFFYIYLKPEYIFILITVTLLNYYSALLFTKFQGSKRKKIFYISLSLNLIILIAFKYLNFIFVSVNSVLSLAGINYQFGNTEMQMPIGISFYIFIALGYMIDVYRKTIDAEKNIGIVSLFVSFFPIVLSGPIERSSRLLPQFKNISEFNYDDVTTGMKRFVWGLFKKVVIADRLAVFVNIIFNNPQKYKGLFLIIGVVFYAYQIYCDFSGYSDMAIGTAQIFGFKIMNNFKRPYYSKSILEFWRRWHISLSEWLRDYLFLPTAYSIARKGKSGKYLFMKTENASYFIATLVTMLLIGLWHGASWNFVFWGFLFAFFMIISRITKKARNKIVNITNLRKYPLVLKIIRIGFTFMLVCFCWIFFRSQNFNDAFYIIINSFKDLNLGFNTEYIMRTFTETGYSKLSFAICVLLIVILEIIQLFQRKGSIIKHISLKPLYLRWGLYIIFMITLIVLSAPTKQKFLYFQF